MTQQNVAVRRGVLAALALLVVWRLFATFLWVAPRSEAREVVPDGVLSAYMLPLFGQSWSVFAPDPIQADYHLDVRALVETDGEQTTTDWVRPTDAELSLAHHNLFPPRAAKVASDHTTALYSAYRDLDDEDLEAVGWDWFEGDWSARLAERLEGQGVSSRYIDAERIVAAYATQVAHAVWGDDVIRVQFRVSRQAVIPFDQRNAPDAERPDPVVQTYGWRGLIENEGQSRDDFRAYFCAVPRGVCS